MLPLRNPQQRDWLWRTGGAARRKLRENKRLLVVAVSSALMSASQAALRPIMPLFAKVKLRLRYVRSPHLCSLTKSCARWFGAVRFSAMHSAVRKSLL